MTSKKKKRRLPAKLCGAKLVDGSGRTCEHSAGWGTGTYHGRCKKHGGKTPSHVKAVQRAVAEEAVITYGLPITIEPTDALLEEVYRTAGHVHWLGAAIAKMEADDLVYGVARERARTAGAGDGATVERMVERRSQMAMMLQLYNAERRHLVNVCSRAIAAGIAERNIQIAEHEAAIFAAALRGMFKDLGVEDHPDLGKIVRRHLTLIVGGKAS